MYVLAVDESGTHNTANVLLLAGLAVHEADIRNLETTLRGVLVQHLSPLGLTVEGYELHATDIKTPSRGKPARPPYRATSPSEWLTVPSSVRLDVLRDAYAAITSFQPADPTYPPRIFAAVIDRQHPRYGAAAKADDYAYEHVIHRFDDMLTRQTSNGPATQRGLVLHDQRRSHERRIQQQAALWQRQGTGLSGLLQVPLFVDSKASRLVQAADLVAHSLWRHYQPTSDDTYSSAMWSLADANERGELTSVIHVTPKWRQCPCPPCSSRSKAPSS